MDNKNKMQTEKTGAHEEVTCATGIFVIIKRIISCISLIKKKSVQTQDLST